MNSTRLLISAALPIILPAAAFAQPFSLEWSTIDCGGAIGSSASGYALHSTVGQPDAGTLSAAPFQCQGGFWNTGEVEPPNCYANCDDSSGSPLLTANDFQCFLDRYAAGESYANCDGSTGNPTLTANDFQCFLNGYAAGCS